MSINKAIGLCEKLLKNVPLLQVEIDGHKHVIAVTQTAFIVNPETERRDYVELNGAIDIPLSFVKNDAIRKFKTEQIIQSTKDWLQFKPAFNAHINVIREWDNFTKQKFNPIIMNPKGFGFGLNSVSVTFNQSFGDTPAFMLNSELFTKLFNYFVERNSPYKGASLNFSFTFPKIKDHVPEGPIVFFDRYNEIAFGIMPLLKVRFLD